MSLHQKRERILLGLVLAVFAAAVINLSLFSFRIDLTSAGAWSISDATKSTLAQAKEGVAITYYLSKKLTTYYPVTQSLADFLEEYAAASGGKVRVKIVDPQDSGEIANLQRLGIQGNQIDVIEQSQQTQAIVYSGILIQYLDRQEVLPQIDRLDSLEFDLTSRIARLITQKKVIIGFLSADPTKTVQESYPILSQTLSKNAEVQTLQPGEAIGPQISALIVAGSKNIDQKNLKPIDDYLMQGGKLFVAADGVFVDIASRQNPIVPAGDNALLKALEGWGVRVNQSVVLDSYNTVVQFQSPQGLVLRRYPLWPNILAKNTSTSNPVTRRFGGLTLMWTSPLDVLKKPGIQVESLAQTSEKSWLMKDNLALDPDQAERSRIQPDADPRKHDVVLALSGRFTSAFPNGGQSPATRIVVVGSSNFLTNLMQMTQTDANATFTENAVDWLAQDEALLAIKTRTLREHSLSLLQDPSVRQAAAFELSFFNLFLIPVLVLVGGVIRFVRRSRREIKGVN